MDNPTHLPAIDTHLLRQYVETVGQMRASQKAWFSKRLVKDLDESKRLEREVDKLQLEISNYLEQLENNNYQLNLF